MPAGHALAVQPSSRIGPLARIAYLVAAALLVHLGVLLDVDHPVQVAMEILAPLPFLFLAMAGSYRSMLAQVALAASLLLWAVMIAQPFLHPKPWLL